MTTLTSGVAGLGEVVSLHAAASNASATNVRLALLGRAKMKLDKETPGEGEERVGSNGQVSLGCAAPS